MGVGKMRKCGNAGPYTCKMREYFAGVRVKCRRKMQELDSQQEIEPLPHGAYSDVPKFCNTALQYLGQLEYK